MVVVFGWFCGWGREERERVVGEEVEDPEVDWGGACCAVFFISMVAKLGGGDWISRLREDGDARGAYHEAHTRKGWQRR